MTTFVSRPAHLNKRFDPILDACRQSKLSEEELEQYISAMITEHEKESIAAAYKEEGFLEGMEKGLEKGLEKGRAESAKALKRLVLAIPADGSAAAPTAKKKPSS